MLCDELRKTWPARSILLATLIDQPVVEVVVVIALVRRAAAAALLLQQPIDVLVLKSGISSRAAQAAKARAARTSALRTTGPDRRRFRGGAAARCSARSPTLALTESTDSRSRCSWSSTYSRSALSALDALSLPLCRSRATSNSASSSRSAAASASGSRRCKERRVRRSAEQRCTEGA